MNTGSCIPVSRQPLARRKFLKSALGASLFCLGSPLSALVSSVRAGEAAKPPRNLSLAETGLDFIDTRFENASPIWYEPASDGVVNIFLLYDCERSSPNRAAGHFHFLLEGKAGAQVTLEFKNLDNIWNGTPGSVARELKLAVVSPDGRTWRTAPTQALPEDRVRLTVQMPGPRLYVARVEPYRLSDLDALLSSVRRHSQVKIETLGKTIQGRPLEILRIGNARAAHRVFLRARAHPWEAGGSWVIQGLIQELLRKDNAHFRKDCCVYILPLTNKDGVARGRTRFNLRGVDLNRGWDRPADPLLAPENFGLERWLEKLIKAGQAPQLAMELHNDGNGQLHISRPPVAGLAGYLDRMIVLEQLLRKHTWFTEGSTGGGFRNSGTLGDGWLERYGIDAVVHEFNCNWIAGLNDYPSARHWRDYGARLVQVFSEFFNLAKT